LRLCIPFHKRKNWLFAGSKAGGERAAATYSVIETAKLNGVEPQAYIADVIEKIASGWPASRWDELMPWNWTAQSAPVSMAACPTRSHGLDRTRTRLNSR